MPTIGAMNPVTITGNQGELRHGSQVVAAKRAETDPGWPLPQIAYSLMWRNTWNPDRLKNIIVSLQAPAQGPRFIMTMRVDR